MVRTQGVVGGKVHAVSGWSGADRPGEAIDQVLGGFDPKEAGFGVAFVSPRYDHEEVTRALRDRFDCPLLACTTAGELTSKCGYRTGGIAAAAVRGVAARSVVIQRPRDFTIQQAREVVAELTSESVFPESQRAAVMVIDGLSMAEERVSAYMHAALGGIPIAGGSAGDGHRFQETYVFDGQGFVRDAAVIVMLESPSGFAVGAHHHFEPTDSRLVVTDADTSSRQVKELNGRPAREAYAEALNLKPEEIDAVQISMHPMLLRSRDEYYVRGIQSILPDGTMQLYGAIDIGLVLSIGRPTQFTGRLGSWLGSTMNKKTALVLGFDCVLRGIEAEATEQQKGVAKALAHTPFVGFSTYGEQINGLHVNQTLTSLIIQH